MESRNKIRRGLIVGVFIAIFFFDNWNFAFLNFYGCMVKYRIKYAIF